MTLFFSQSQHLSIPIVWIIYCDLSESWSCAKRRARMGFTVTLLITPKPIFRIINLECSYRTFLGWSNRWASGYKKPTNLPGVVISIMPKGIFFIINLSFTRIFYSLSGFLFFVVFVDIIHWYRLYSLTFFSISGCLVLWRSKLLHHCGYREWWE